MRLRRVYIKRSGGEIASEACYTAWRGFSSLGYPLDFFEWEDLNQERLRLDRLTLVVGGTVSVHRALRQIGVPVPKPLNIPDSLREFAGRSLWESTLGEIRGEIESGRSAVFIKPLIETKSFAGLVVAGRGELEGIRHLGNDLAVQVAEPVPFASEWRYYVHRGSIVGIAHYKGEWAYFPDVATVQKCIARYSECPAAYSLDFGVSAEGRTLLVEANDAFALGAHGTDAVAYAKMLEDRWLEITEP